MAKGNKDEKQTVKSPQPQGSEKGKSNNGLLFGILAFLTAVIVIVGVFGVAFYFVIHNNVNGLGEKYRSNIQKYPLIKWVLPAVADPGDSKYLTPDEIKKRYEELRKNKDVLTKQLDDATKQIKDLQKLKDDLDKANADNAKIKQDAADKETQLADREKKLADEKKKVDSLIANGDKAGFKSYFETLDSATAQKIYADIMKEQKASDDIKKSAQLYESMDPAAAAKIFEQLGNTKIDLVVNTLKNMKKEISAEVMAGMDPVFAAKIAEKLYSSNSNTTGISQ